MKYLSIIVLILLCGCKEKKEVSTLQGRLVLDTGWTIISNTDSMTSTLVMDTTTMVMKRIESGWLQGREYDRPKKRKKKAIKWCFDNNGMEWNPSWNLNYRDTTNGGKYYDSSYTIIWDSSGYQFGGGIQAVPKGYKSKEKDVYDYSVIVPFDTLPHHGYEGAEMYPRGAIVFSNPTDKLMGDTGFINKWIDSSKYCREFNGPAFTVQYSQDSSFKWGDNTYQVINGKSHLIRHSDYVGSNGGFSNIVLVGDNNPNGTLIERFVPSPSDNHPDGEIRRFKKIKNSSYSYNIVMDTTKHHYYDTTPTIPYHYHPRKPGYEAQKIFDTSKVRILYDFGDNTSISIDGWGVRQWCVYYKGIDPGSCGDCTWPEDQWFDTDILFYADKKTRIDKSKVWQYKYLKP